MAYLPANLPTLGLFLTVSVVAKYILYIDADAIVIE